MAGVFLKKFYVLWMFSMNNWEYDHTREIFPTSRFEHISYKKLDDYPENVQPEIIIYNVENAGDDCSYEKVKELTERYKAKILVHFADKYGGVADFKNFSAGAELYNMVRSYSSYPVPACYYGSHSNDMISRIIV
jgi:hypothetical protein